MSTEFAGFLDDYRCVVNVHINAGPIAPDERMQNREDYKENLISAETAMSRNGIEDSVAERALIEGDRNAAAGMLVKQATAIKTLTDAGAREWRKFYGSKKRWNETPPAQPGDVWRVRWYRQNRQNNDGPIAGYDICCPRCRQVHAWTTAHQLRITACAPRRRLHLRSHGQIVMLDVDRERGGGHTHRESVAPCSASTAAAAGTVGCRMVISTSSIQSWPTSAERDSNLCLADELDQLAEITPADILHAQKRGARMHRRDSRIS
jgi:hypothetical protein